MRHIAEQLGISYGSVNGILKSELNIKLSLEMDSKKVDSSRPVNRAQNIRVIDINGGLAFSIKCFFNLQN